MELPTYSLLFTTVRPHLVWYVCHTWLTKAARPANIELIIATDKLDMATGRAAQYAATALPGYAIRHVVHQDTDGNCVKGWNLAASVSTGQVLVQVSDDFMPPIGWDVILKTLQCHCGRTAWWQHDHAVHVNDGFVVSIMTMAVITRKRYERYGYLFYPEYKSMFCDTELTDVAYRDNVVIDAKRVTFEHQHYNRSARTMDKADLTHGSKARWDHGEALYNKRKAAGFPAPDAA